MCVLIAILSELHRAAKIQCMAIPTSKKVRFLPFLDNGVAKAKT